MLRVPEHNALVFLRHAHEGREGEREREREREREGGEGGGRIHFLVPYFLTLGMHTCYSHITEKSQLSNQWVECKSRH